MKPPPVVDRTTAAVLLLTGCAILFGVVWVVRHPAKPSEPISPLTQSTPEPKAEQPKALSPAPVPTARKHESFYNRELQDFEERIVNMSQGRVAETTLEVCFSEGYTGIDQSDDAELTRNVGPLSNRNRAECDAILRTEEESEAADKAREKKLDEAYDKEHGLSPSGSTKQPTRNADAKNP